jgi:hypothetical protein
MLEFGPSPDRFVCALAALMFATLSFASVLVPAAI